jgi:gluconolactonase
MQPILPASRASIFFDATVGPVRLNHPEGLAVAADGAIWCCGETGEIYRIEPDGSKIEQIATTGGFTLGMAFDDKGRLFTCDLAHKAVFRFDPSNGALERFVDGVGMFNTPNHPAVDVQRNSLFVSDSRPAGMAGPSVWRFDLDSGDGGVWHEPSFNFANGLALSPDRNWLYVVETFASQVRRIPILADGSAGEGEVFVSGIERLPDGIAFDAESNLFISCYEPSRVFRATPDGRLELFIDDPDAHLFCHPTNCAFRGTDLFTANLGRWHITRIEAGVAGAPLL